MTNNHTLLKVAAAAGVLAYVFRARLQAAFSAATLTAPGPPQPTISIQPVEVARTPDAPATPITYLVPITPEILQRASWDLNTALLIEKDVRAQFNWDQWSYYRNEAGKGQIVADGFDADNRQATMSAVEYLRRLRAMGLAGVKWR